MPHHRCNVATWLFCLALAAGSATLANSSTATAQSAQEQLESTIIIIEALKSRTPRGISRFRSGAALVSIHVTISRSPTGDGGSAPTGKTKFYPREDR